MNQIMDEFKVGNTNVYSALRNEKQQKGDRGWREGIQGLTDASDAVYDDIKDKLGITKMSPELRQRIHDALSLSALKNWYGGGNDEEIRADAAKILMDPKAWDTSRDTDGNVTVKPRKSPNYTRDPDGNIVAAEPFNHKQSADAIEFIKRTGLPNALNGTKFSVNVDEDTPHSGLVFPSYYDETSGDDRTFTYEAGAKVPFSPEMANSEMFRYLKKEQMADGRVAVQMPSEEDFAVVDVSPHYKGYFKDGKIKFGFEQKHAGAYVAHSKAFEHETRQTNTRNRARRVENNTPEKVEFDLFALGKAEQQRRDTYEAVTSDIEYLDDAGETVSFQGRINRQIRNAYVDELFQNGQIGPRAADQMKNNFMDLTPPVPKSAKDELLGYERELIPEGRIMKVVKDKFKGPDGKMNNAKSIGYGFNLERPDADEMLKLVGAPTKKQLLDGASITEEQARDLKMIAIEKVQTWLRKHFEGVSMRPNQWIALTSLAYNSKWNNDGPTLIGPNLTKFIKNAEWGRAADEIRYRSAGVDNPKYREGILIRRRKEAALFSGDYTVADLTS
jgi:GH24 family phage-related lysozyme (muramidase)